MILLNHEFALYQTGFIKTLWSSTQINAPLCYFALKMNFKHISYLTMLLLKRQRRKSLDNKLYVSSHLTGITKKANIKLNNLTRAQKYITPEQNTFIKFSFVKSQFNYCSLIWLFCIWKALSRLNNIHERSLRRVHEIVSQTLLRF